MEPVFLMRLSRTLVIASGSTARGAAGFELDVRGVSYLVLFSRVQLCPDLSCLREGCLTR
jgi:hypothetical protein